VAKKDPSITKVPKGALKNFLDAGKSTTRVIGKVERHVLSKPRDASRNLELHPSQIVSKQWCHRASYFHLLGHPPAIEPTTFRKERIFGEGSDIHTKWQKWFQEMGVLYGMWECKACKHRFWATSPNICIDCHLSVGFKYKEVPVDVPSLRMTGHGDGWLKGFGDDLMLEIKSVGVGTFLWMDKQAWMAANQDFDKAWNNLKVPFESHIQQVQIYMRLLELAGHESVPQEAVLIYEAKPNQEIKEFIVQKDGWGINHLIDAAKMIVECVDKGTPPDCNVGGVYKCDKCKGYENA
jgi:hypothetical protein